MTTLATVTDPDGYEIELTSERWAHILLRHPELRDQCEAILCAVVRRLSGWEDVVQTSTGTAAMRQTSEARG